jgi:hypothetical protein
MRGTPPKAAIRLRRELLSLGWNIQNSGYVQLEAIFQALFVGPASFSQVTFATMSSLSSSVLATF